MIWIDIVQGWAAQKGLKFAPHKGRAGRAAHKDHPLKGGGLKIGVT